jgi:hypothetical protein
MELFLSDLSWSFSHRNLSLCIYIVGIRGANALGIQDNSDTSNPYTSCHKLLNRAGTS